MALPDPINPLFGPPGALARPRYEPNGYLAAADLEAEQAWLAQRLRRHNRYMHGWGVVCGFKVVPEPDQKRPWAVRICPGYALGPYGDEIYSNSPIILDISEFAWSRPPNIFTAYVAVRAIEQDIRPKPAPPSSCGCEETSYEFSRRRDGIEAAVLWQLVEEPRGTIDICRPGPTVCAPCPSSPYLVLASVLLPQAEGDTIQSVSNQAVALQPWLAPDHLS